MKPRSVGCTCPDLQAVIRAELEGINLPDECPVHVDAAREAAARADVEEARADAYRAVVAELRPQPVALNDGAGLRSIIAGALGDTGTFNPARPFDGPDAA